MRRHLRAVGPAMVLTAALGSAALAAPAASATDRPGHRPVVEIQARGASLTTADDRVFAALLPSPPPSRYVITSTPDGVRITDQTTGGLLHAPTTEDFTQLEVAPVGQTPPNSEWTVLDPQGGAHPRNVVPKSGYYVLQSADGRHHIGRHDHEDRSLLPKRVVLRPDESHIEPLTINVIG